MQFRHKVALGVTAVVLAFGAAAATPLVILNTSMQDVAAKDQEANTKWANIQLTADSDPKFNAVANKLTYDTSEVPVNSAAAFEASIPAGPIGDIYRSLPAVKTVISNLEKSDAMQKERIANNTLGKVKALEEAKRVCQIMSKDPAVNTMTTEEKNAFFNSKNMMANLPAYLEYCKDASSS